MSARKAEAEHLRNLIDEYWNVAVAEGREGRTTDASGQAGFLWSRINASINALAAPGAEAAVTAEAAAQADDVWPIVNLDIDEQGVITNAKLYAPGLPAGNHDVYPVRVPYMDEHTEAWLACAKALREADPACFVGPGSGIECAVAAIHRLAAQPEQNQCDGCLRGLPIRGGLHRSDGEWPVGCSAPTAQPEAPVAPAGWPIEPRPYDPTQDMIHAAKRLDPAMTVEQVRAMWAAMWSAAPTAPAVRPTDDKLWDQTLRERDGYQDWADKLAAAIAAHTGVDIGEHSSVNCPWLNALDAIPEAPAVPVPLLTDEEILEIWIKSDTPSKENDCITGPIPFACAIEAAVRKKCGVKS